MISSIYRRTFCCDYFQINQLGTLLNQRHHVAMRRCPHILTINLKMRIYDERKRKKQFHLLHKLHLLAKIRAYKCLCGAEVSGRGERGLYPARWSIRDQETNSCWRSSALSVAWRNSGLRLLLPEGLICPSRFSRLLGDERHYESSSHGSNPDVPRLANVWRKACM